MMMWRKETRWHSFSREHSGVKLFSQRARCSQLELEVGQHLAELEIYGHWVIPVTAELEAKQEVTDAFLRWPRAAVDIAVVEGQARHGGRDSRLIFGGSLLALDSTVAIRGQTGRCPELDWAAFPFSLHSVL